VNNREFQPVRRERPAAAFALRKKQVAAAASTCAVKRSAADGKAANINKKSSSDNAALSDADFYVGRLCSPSVT